MLSSYGQVFFSTHRTFGLLLLLASFADIGLALAGLFSVLIGLLFAKVLGYDKESIGNGTFTFNALLSGMALSALYEPSATLLFLMALAACISVLLSGAFLQMGKYLGIPFLSLPFIVSVWLLQLAIRAYWFAELTPRTCVNTWQAFPHIEHYFHYRSVTLGYFKSLSQIFFQKSVLSGFIIAFGLLLHSRIAFVLSILGYCSAWLLFHLPFLPHHQHTIGAFNYVLTAIALGAYFYVPSRSSFFVALLSMPLVLLLAAVATLPQTIALAPYSLAFSVSVIVVLTALRNRSANGLPEAVAFQSFSPESNLYAASLYKLRFALLQTQAIHLPFFGKWLVTQAHDGSITHKNEHRYAFDFSVTDEHKRSFKLPGKTQDDFYCFGLPVVAPADGRVVKCIDDIEDNQIGHNNFKQNWGNTIVIKHNEYLYSKLSHLKKESIKVRQGDYVQSGTIIGNCGNSGRSPEPHIHFQLQSIAAVGAGTLKYPLANYLVEKNTELQFVDRGYPNENEFVQNAEPLAAIANAFTWHIEHELKIEDADKTEHSFKACYDEVLGHYLVCMHTGSKAFYTKDNYSISFSYFQGTTNTALYHFFLAANAVSFVDNSVYEAPLLASTFRNTSKDKIYDFMAPFVKLQHPTYRSQTKTKGSTHSIEVEITQRKSKTITADLQIEEASIVAFHFQNYSYRCL